jgi:hypothetical protein
MGSNVTLGHFTMEFLRSPARLPTVEFFGVAFVIFAVALYWGRYINDLA